MLRYSITPISSHLAAFHRGRSGPLRRIAIDELRTANDDPLLGEPGGIQEPPETFNSKYGGQSDENPGGHCR